MKLSAIVMAASTAAMFAFGSTFASSQTTSSPAPIQVETFPVRSRRFRQRKRRLR